MSYFALLWKARTIEKYRLKYEKEKINSLMMANTEIPKKTFFQKCRVYRYDAQKRISTKLKKLCPKGSTMSNFFIYLKTDQTFPNFVLKSVLGFVGGIILTYLCFMFFVFQLSISLIHATIMSSIIGVLLTLGLAFSYRIRCLVLLLIPQFFSRVGRYTLTCYALVLILTGPATNTLKNSEVLSESMACSQEQIKTSVHEIRNSVDNPLNAVKDSVKLIIDKMNIVALRVKKMLINLNRMVLSLVSVIQSSLFWLESTAKTCDKNLGTPYEHCTDVMKKGAANCKSSVGPETSSICSVAHLAYIACIIFKPFNSFCNIFDCDEAFAATIKKKLKNFNDRIRAMLFVDVHIHHSYTVSSNASRSASQVAAGIVTEIRNRADPLLTWLSWSSCVTSLFLLLIIFRAKYYQHMYETRSRFDNRYVTRELRELDLNRQRQGRGTVLPLNRRERAKYITTTSFRLVSTEKLHLNRSAVFMVITTFKLLIHMIADYSLYWVLMIIRYHGRFQSPLSAGTPVCGVQILGSGFAAGMLRSLIGSLNIPLMSPMSHSVTCLPDPYPPDFRRYSQIGVLIILLWFFALFEPYGLRLRHMIMGHYRPERAKARAVWLYNHILRTRGSFMKLARRKLHREYKYCSEAKFTFRRWLQDLITCQWLRSLLGIRFEEPHCLLCGTLEKIGDLDTQLIRCETPNCPGIFCYSCFTDIGQLCTICLSPTDYGDQSDASLEKGLSDDSDSDDDSSDAGPSSKFNSEKKYSSRGTDNSLHKRQTTRESKFRFNTKKTVNIPENIPLLKHKQNEPQNPFNYNSILLTHKKHKTIPALKLSDNKINKKNTHKNVKDEYTQDNSRLTDELEVLKKTTLVSLNDQNLKNYETYIEKKCRLLLPQRLLRQFKILITYFRRNTSPAWIGFKNRTSKYNRLSKNENTVSINKCDSRRLYRLIFQLNFFNRVVVVNAYKFVRKSSHQKLRCKKYTQRVKRRKYNRYSAELPKTIIGNKSEVTKNLTRNVILNNNYKNKTVTNGDHDHNKESKPENLDFMNGECSRSNKPTKLNDDKPEANHKPGKTDKSNDKAKQDDIKHLGKCDEKSRSCKNKLHILWSKYCKSFKLIVPCTDSMSDKRRSCPFPKENKNFKHRKKIKALIEPLIKGHNNEKRKEMEDARNYRIEAYLAQQQCVNYIHVQERGHGDRKKDDIAINEVLLKIKNKALSIKTKETKSISDLQLKSPLLNFNLANHPNEGCKSSMDFTTFSSDMFHINEQNNSSKISDDYQVSSCQNNNQSRGDKSEKREKDSLGSKYYQEAFKDDITVNNKLLRQHGFLSDDCNQQNTAVCSKDLCLGNIRNPSNKISEDLSEQWPLLTKTHSGRLIDIGRGLKKPLSVLQELYTVLFGKDTEKRPSISKKKDKQKSISLFDKCINTLQMNFSRGIQCYRQDRRVLEKNQCVQVNLKKRTSDANVNTENDTCTCATQNILENEIGYRNDRSFSWKNHVFQHKKPKNVSYRRSKSADKNYSSHPMEDLKKNDTSYQHSHRNHRDDYNLQKKQIFSSSTITLDPRSSDETKTDTTVCSLATIDYNDKKKRNVNKVKVKVVTKANQSTLTDRQSVCNIGTYIDDWWSPILERRDLDIMLEKKRGYMMQNQMNHDKRQMKNTGLLSAGRIVTFKSRAQIIPSDTIDILSPSRYLLESQKYYNELFSSKFYTPHVFPVRHVQRCHESDRKRSPTGSRRQTRRSKL